MLVDNSINEALRLLRIFNDLKAVDLAKELNISNSYLSEIEKGRKMPTLEIINKYAEFFNTTPSTILFFSENLNKDGDNLKRKIGNKLIHFLQKIENASAENL
jgi:transcriptional regulator with XRE-family HTH domain